jgi:hypothetical protein
MESSRRRSMAFRSGTVRAVAAAIAGVVLFALLPATSANAANDPFRYYVRQTNSYGKSGRVHLCHKPGEGYPTCTSEYDLGPVGAIGTPATVTNCEGKMHVFVVGWGNGLYVKWQVTPGSFVYSDPWFSMGGYLTSNPAAYLNYQGRIEVFARGADNAVWTRWQTSACGGWSNWARAGVSQIIDYPIVTLSYNQNGYVSLLATGTDNRLWLGIRDCWACSWRWIPCPPTTCI